MSAPTGPTPGASPEGTQVPTNQPPNPIVVNVANYVRSLKELKARTGLLNNKEDVEFFRFKRLRRVLTNDAYKAKSADGKNKLIPINSEEEFVKLFVLMIQSRLIVPVSKLHYDEIKKVKGWKPNRKKPTLQPSSQATMEPDAYYAWTYAKPNPMMLVYSILMIATVFIVILFPLWPMFMRTGVWYLSMAAMGLLGLLFATAIVRLIIFVITYLAMPQAFWLFPNLFEDCGVLESFQPVYGWSGDLSKKKKKSKSKSEAASGPKIEEIGRDDAEATGSQPSTSSATKRTVTLEEVDE
ncbi:hypothetical protein PUMCH_003315 [Australozyma saopauloensis]|uniref:Translocation protein SEC62 n=1 Tax=Australozyma saopauloensis TaxID=291208 RepID=A0AAX4HBL2_9ASCO|nr:hypothetical protein PUMCH_003315 [[Candida] saopauloensis]